MSAPKVKRHPVKAVPLIHKGSRGRGKPQCNLHDMEMVFFPERLRWECVEPDCTMIAFPEEDAQTGKPIVNSGNVSAYLIDGKVFLRSGDSRFWLDVTEFVPPDFFTLSGPSFTAFAGNVHLQLKPIKITKVDPLGGDPNA